MGSASCQGPQADAEQGVGHNLRCGSLGPSRPQGHVTLNVSKRRPGHLTGLGARWAVEQHLHFILVFTKVEVNRGMTKKAMKGVTEMEVTLLDMKNAISRVNYILDEINSRLDVIDKIF